MRSILNEMARLRGGQSPVLDYRNSNRYRLVASEENGTKTAYCFAVPIYNRKSKRLVNLRFYENGGIWRSCGSGADITAANGFLLENEDGFCRIGLPGELLSVNGTGVRYGAAAIVPTLNGICVRVPCPAGQMYSLTLLSDQPFMNVHANDRCFSLMRGEFTPFVTVSCIGVLDGAGRVIAPSTLHYQKNSDTEYALTLGHASPFGRTLLFEINLHEEKLIQDTTVESGRPEMNNAFGGTAFIGRTASCGEQWLYARPDFSKLPELYDKQIRKAVLHIPQYGGNCSLAAWGLTARFCSFGSNWENKIQAAEELTDVAASRGYQSLDITGLVTDSARFLKPSEGFILKPKNKESGFSVVSTGDSYFAPQILEVNFR